MRRRPARALCALIIIIALPGAVAAPGCGKPPEIAGDDPRVTAEAFAAALDAEDFQRAADAFDYVTFARQQNENWDDIPGGQRELIIRKLKEDKAGELKTLRARVGGNVQCGPVANGNVVSLTGDAGSVTIELAEMDGKWRIRHVW